MNGRARIAGVPICICAVVSATADARQAAGRPTPAAEQNTAAFLADLQHAVDEHNVQRVASLLHYPTIVLSRGLQIPIQNREALPALYKIAFTPEIRCVIDNSRLPRPGQQASDVETQITPDGLVLGRGAIRVLRRGERLGITRVVVPAGTVTTSGTRAPKRIRLSAETTQLSGLLERDDVDAYVFAARKGQRMFARIEGFAGHEAALRVSAQQDGKNVSVPSEQAGRSWSGSLPLATDYRLEVVRLARYCDPALVYFLGVTLQ
jgi:hypothetical protein